MALARSALLTTVTIASAFATVAIANATPAAAAHVPVAATVIAPVVAPPAPVQAKPAVTHKPSPKPSPSPKATHKAVVHHVAPKPVATHTASPKPTATHTATSTALPFADRMMNAVNRIPTYRSGDAMWIVRKQANWGLALMGGGTVYISPSVPNDKLYDVVVHEWSHLLSVRNYGNDVDTATSEMNRVFGGTGLVGSERAADCMALLQGAHWTHYTPCNNSAWRAAARKLVAGQRL